MSIENCPTQIRGVVLHPDVWTNGKIYLERMQATSEQDSGWYIGPATDTPATGTSAPGDAPAYLAVRLGDIVQARKDLLNCSACQHQR